MVTPLLVAAGGMPQAAVLGTSLLAMLPPSTVSLLLARHHISRRCPACANWRA